MSLNSSKSSPLLHEKLCVCVGNLTVLTQAEGPGLTGWCYLSYLMALLSSPLSRCMNEVLKCRGLVHRVGGTWEQLMHKQLPVHRCRVGSWSSVSCSCPLQARALKGNLNSSFMLAPASGGGGGGSPPGSPTVERVCCLWYAWIFCACSL